MIEKKYNFDIYHSLAISIHNNNLRLTANSSIGNGWHDNGSMSFDTEEEALAVGKIIIEDCDAAILKNEISNFMSFKSNIQKGFILLSSKFDDRQERLKKFQQLTKEELLAYILKGGPGLDLDLRNSAYSAFFDESLLELKGVEFPRFLEFDVVDNNVVSTTKEAKCYLYTTFPVVKNFDYNNLENSLTDVIKNNANSIKKYITKEGLKYIYTIEIFIYQLIDFSFFELIIKGSK